MEDVIGRLDVRKDVVLDGHGDDEGNGAKGARVCFWHEKELFVASVILAISLEKVYFDAYEDDGTVRVVRVW